MAEKGVAYNTHGSIVPRPKWNSDPLDTYLEEIDENARRTRHAGKGESIASMPSAKVGVTKAPSPTPSNPSLGVGDRKLRARTWLGVVKRPTKQRVARLGHVTI